MNDDMEVKQEQGTPEKINGKEDRFQDFDADKMIVSELEAYDNQINDKLKSVLEGLNQTKQGAGHLYAEIALLEFCVNLSDLGAYGAKNWKLYSPVEIIGASFENLVDNSKTVAFCRTRSLYNNKEFITDYGKLISEMVQNDMFKYAYSMIRMNAELPHLSDIYSKIIYGFNEYNNLRVYYGNAEIIKELKLHKNTAPEENYQIAKAHLDNYINGKPNLTALLSSGGFNDLCIIDRITCAFQKIYQAKDSMKGYIESAKKTMDDCDKKSEMFLNVIKFEKHTLKKMRDVLVAIIEVFETALKLIDEYVNETGKPPYAFMHYDSTIKETADRWLSDSLPDPLTNGTKYGYLIKQVKKSWDSILRPIANNAAKWGLD